MYPVWIAEFTFMFNSAEELNQLEAEWQNGLTYKKWFYGAEKWRAEYKCGVWIAHFEGRCVL